MTFGFLGVDNHFSTFEWGVYANVIWSVGEQVQLAVFFYPAASFFFVSSIKIRLFRADQYLVGGFCAICCVTLGVLL
jgi:hypothetical protein